MLDAAAPSLRVRRAPALPIGDYLAGRPVEEVRSLVPRLFNLCSAAQAAAVDTALGLDPDAAPSTREILRDHLFKFHVSWPGHFGRPPSPLPVDWAEGGDVMRRAVFGPAMRAPATPADFFAFLSSGTGVAPVLLSIAGCFPEGLATAPGLERVTPDTIWCAAPVENSVAARHADHPAMQGIEARTGRGPLWRAAARLYDIDALLDGQLPAPHRAGPAACVPAARGLYAVRIESAAGTVTRFERVTPTDSLMAPGGVLDRTLASLPADRAGLGPLLLDILDPCSPLRLEEARHA